jgi:aerobic-type carbon monoxide dehydrogenase small subunit (CoxS/CutS family)
MQCSYCTSGMIMSAYAMLQKKANPSDDEIIRTMNGNICRCGTYQRILTAIKEGAKALQKGAR